MTISLLKSTPHVSGSIVLTGSKSLSNRTLIIQALSSLNVELLNCSNSDDTQHLQKALDSIRQKQHTIIDVGHAGTDLRFLTALLSITNGEFVLTGSERLQQRPIEPLVTVLQQLGATINYEKTQGFPPLRIIGKTINGGAVDLPSSISSQFVSALLMVAPYFKNGLTLHLIGDLVSKPYVDMTIDVMKHFNGEVEWKKNTIVVSPKAYEYKGLSHTIESDWSAASYYYSFIALSPMGTSVSLSILYKNGLQADALCATIYEYFGVTTQFEEDKIIITKSTLHQKNTLVLDFINHPDIAQTIACTCLGLNISFEFTGLQTLIVKETNRIQALQTEFQKFGEALLTTKNSLSYHSQQQSATLETPICIDTYSDHRMAMSFAPLCLVYDGLVINEAEVVSKSYPYFWDDIEKIGITVLRT